MNLFLRGFLLLIFFVILWQGLVVIFNLPDYILPTPLVVFSSLCKNFNLIVNEFIPTFFETILGLAFGILFGTMTAAIMIYVKPIKLWFLPILIISQAIPTFAIAPLLVIWFGYGITSKIITTVIMIFFPITNALFDGLNRTPREWLELAKNTQGTKWRTFRLIRFPAALPAYASGIRIAAAIAPIGAIVGEWVGASQGLGYLMLNSNARMQIDLMFAALIVIIIFSLVLYFVVDLLLKKLINWKVVLS